ncbi:hypothetical protein NTG1052_740005 [Candidatus Nitrotoga sp. 1052]|nr:hypothetical protein NTG1052_740005 [Candidatus Nitrotoga sp. 1052]
MGITQKRIGTSQAFQNPCEAIQAITEYIEIFYKRQRIMGSTKLSIVRCI